MASLLVPRSPVACLLLVVVVVISFMAVGDSARASAPPPTTAKKPIEVYPGCSNTTQPKRCSVRLAKLAKSLVETKATIAGPDLAAKKLKTDSCITECAKVVDVTASKVIAAKADKEALTALRGYLYDTAINTYDPIGPCECNCPEPCTADQSAAVKKLGEATGSMRDLGNLLEDLIGHVSSEEEKAAAAEAEKSMDSGVLHVSCGLTKEPQKCTDELSALDRITTEAKNAVNVLSKTTTPAPAIDHVITDCRLAIESVNGEIYSAEGQVKNLADIRAALRSNVKGDGKKPPLCKYYCPPPPEKPCSANEKAIVDKLSSVYNAWVAADKFLTELLPPAEVKGKEKEAPKK